MTTILGHIKLRVDLLEDEVYTVMREDDTIYIIQDFGHSEIKMSTRQAKELVDILITELEYKNENST